MTSPFNEFKDMDDSWNNLRAFVSFTTTSLYCKAVCVSAQMVILYCIVSYRIVSYRIVSYRIVSYHIISYHIISYHIILYYIILYYIILYYIILYYTILHYIYWCFIGKLSVVNLIHQSHVDSPHKGQCRGALIFSLKSASTNGWTDNRGAGDLRRHRIHYHATFVVYH